MDLLRSMRNMGLNPPTEDIGYQKTETLKGQFRPQTLTEMLDGQIEFYKKKIADLEEAKAAISPDVERALNALAKL